MRVEPVFNVGDFVKIVYSGASLARLETKRDKINAFSGRVGVVTEIKNDFYGRVEYEYWVRFEGKHNPVVFEVDDLVLANIRVSLRRIKDTDFSILD